MVRMDLDGILNQQSSSAGGAYSPASPAAVSSNPQMANNSNANSTNNTPNATSQTPFPGNTLFSVHVGASPLSLPSQPSFSPLGTPVGSQQSSATPSNSLANAPNLQTTPFALFSASKNPSAAPSRPHSSRANAFVNPFVSGPNAGATSSAGNNYVNSRPTNNETSNFREVDSEDVFKVWEVIQRHLSS